MVSDEHLPEPRSARTDSDLRELVARQEQQNAALRRQLEHAQRLTTLGSLAAGALHDFNNALTCVLSFNQLNDGSDASSTPLYRAQIDRSARDAVTLAQQLLSLGRDHEARDEPVAIDAHLRVLAGGIERLLAPRVTCEFSIEETGAANIDPVLWSQVVLNLVTNARDAMPDGGTLTLTARETVVEGAPHVEVTVADTGRGVQDRDVPHLFEPFFTTKQERGGTGLGLSMARRILESRGGSIVLDRDVESGAAFRIRLPRIDGEAPRRRAPIELPRGSERVLIVADDPRTSLAVAALAHDLGYVTLTGDGQSAITLAADVDLVCVLDGADTKLRRTLRLDLEREALTPESFASSLRRALDERAR